MIWLGLAITAVAVGINRMVEPPRDAITQTADAETCYGVLSGDLKEQVWATIVGKVAAQLLTDYRKLITPS